MSDTTEKMERALVSAFIICFNEEESIRDCIESVSFCDEVLVIDSHSTDATVSICEELGARVIQRDWPGYKEQKAYGLSQCTHDWVFNIDSDERVSAELRKSIESALALAKTGDAVEGYEVNRVVWYLDRWWRQGGWYPEYRLRLFNKAHVVWGGQDPHEKPVCDGKIERLEGELHHLTYKDFEDQISRLHRYARIVAKSEYDSGKRASVFKLIVNPTSRFVKFYFLKGGFKEGIAGFIVGVLEAYYTFLKYVFLWEIAYNKEKIKADE